MLRHVWYQGSWFTGGTHRSANFVEPEGPAAGLPEVLPAGRIGLAIRVVRQREKQFPQIACCVGVAATTTIQLLVVDLDDAGNAVYLGPRGVDHLVVDVGDRRADVVQLWCDIVYICCVRGRRPVRDPARKGGKPGRCSLDELAL